MREANRERQTAAVLSSEPEGFVRPKVVSAMTGLGVSTLYREAALGRFPKPIKVLGDARNQPSAFLLSEVRQWIADRVAAAKARAA